MMKPYFILIVFISASLCSDDLYLQQDETIQTTTMESELETVILDVKQGRLKGRRQLLSGKEVYAFLGVPYAQPPLEENRFKDPQPLQNWSEVRDALEEGSPCAHLDSISREFIGSEDCLYLNIYTPELPSDPNFEPRAVMVFIHGGGFTDGSANYYLHGPDFFLEEGILFVSFNYRLGAIGFLSTGDSVIPGNFGLKDQAAALRWIKENIAVFGGDPERITAFGESSGAASVHYHVLSPTSKGLFSQVIYQSGSALCPWALASDASRRSFHLGKNLGLSTNNSTELLNFLRTVPTEQIINSQNSVLTSEDEKNSVIFPFVPVIESKSTENAFLSKRPRCLLSEKKYQNVSVMAGFTTQEGLVGIRAVNANPNYLKMLNDDVEILVPQTLCLEYGTEKRKAVGQKIKEFYFGNQTISRELLPKFVDYFSDSWFVHSIYSTLRKNIEDSIPVYFYEFDYDGPLGYFKQAYGAHNVGIKGPCHVDDLAYLFRIEKNKVEANPDSPEGITRRRMLRLWTNFAKYGNPTPEDDPLLSVTWTTASLNNTEILRIGEQLKMVPFPYTERMAFWDSLKREVTECQSKCYKQNIL